ncbi:hypothetical protein CYY_005258 [Polysphondylium violaceum]|uniref:VASt domain-containing protein n=1 Tax=Polysphondylium violaceum TaxID=133409 RepID=A0A8J4USC0_9MYCE|nr:hypothetical protein CYY_005258 [Polysphondylium violaceum]
MKILDLEEEFGLSVETFFTFFFESTNFKQKYHASRGDRDIEIKPWTPTSDGRYTREIVFCSAISNSSVINSIVGDKAKVREVQHYKLADGRLNVIAETFFEGKVGQSFQSVSEWNVVPINEPQPGCKVVIKVKNNYKGTMFKDRIESWVHSTTEDSFKKWLDLVRQQVEEYEKNEQLKRVTPTPVRPQQQRDENDENRNTVIPFEMVDENQQQVIQQNRQSRQQHTTTTTTTTSSNNSNNNNNNNKATTTTTTAISSPVSNKITLSPPLNNHDDESTITMVEEHTTTTFSYHNHHHSNNNRDDSDNESDLSDISHVPPSHLGDFTDDEEYNSNEEFYDTNDVWQSSSSESQKRDIKNFMQTINNDLTNIKSIIEVNHNRLLGLEDSFQSSRNLVGSGVVGNNNNNNINNNRQQHPTTTTTSSSITNGGNVNSDLTTTYLNRLEEMVKNLQEDEMKSREKQKDWEQKIADLEKKLHSLGSSQSKYIMWLNIGAFVFFLIGWPIAAKKIWKHIPKELFGFK